MPCMAKNKTLGFAQTHWGTLPQTPLIELPNPSILEGAPSPVGRSKGELLTHQEGLGAESLSTPYPPCGPVPLTDAIRGDSSPLKWSPLI